jgi:hypothetical protein
VKSSNWKCSSQYDSGISFRYSNSTGLLEYSGTYTKPCGNSKRIPKYSLTYTFLSRIPRLGKTSSNSKSGSGSNIISDSRVGSGVDTGGGGGVTIPVTLFTSAQAVSVSDNAKTIIIARVIKESLLIIIPTITINLIYTTIQQLTKTVPDTPN